MLCPECREVVAPGPMRAKEALEDAAPTACASIRNARRVGAAGGMAWLRSFASRAFGTSRKASLTSDVATSVAG